MSFAFACPPCVAYSPIAVPLCLVQRATSLAHTATPRTTSLRRAPRGARSEGRTRRLGEVCGQTRELRKLSMRRSHMAHERAARMRSSSSNSEGYPRIIGRLTRGAWSPVRARSTELESGRPTHTQRTPTQRCRYGLKVIACGFGVIETRLSL